jgi:hypothetical protein
MEVEGRSLGSFCSSSCLAGVETLAALKRWAGELDARGRTAEAKAREALSDQLLLLWRRHAGPDPRVVAKAVEIARRRDTVARPDT